MLRRRKARASPFGQQRVALGDHVADAVEVGGGARDRVELAEERGELHAQAVDLGELLDVDVGDDGSDAMHRADQPLGLEPGQHPADRRAADRELLGQLLLGEPGAGRVIEQADAIAERLVDALGAGAGRKPLGRRRIRQPGGHPASMTAFRNWRVRSFFGVAEELGGRPLLGDLAGVEEADAVGELPGESHLVGDHQHGQVVLARRGARITSRTSPTSSGSSAEVTSSKSMIFGRMAQARAMATRCCWPPESCDG